MFVKAKKWLSWLLAVTIVAGLIPFNTLSAFAQPGNQSLADAMNTITNTNAETIVLTNKNIVGEVNLSDIRTKFPNARRVNLSGNYITKIVQDDPASTPMVVVNDSNNLLAGAQRTLNYSGGTTPIKRIKYSPTAINVSELFAQINSGKGSLQELIDKGAIESITYEYEVSGMQQTNTVTNGTWANAEISATDVPNLTNGGVLAIKVKFVGDGPNDQPINVPINLELLDAKIEVTGMPATMYTNLSSAEVTITKVGVNGESLDFAADTDVTIDLNPASAGALNVTNKALSADNKSIKATIKFTQDYTGAVDFTLVSNQFKVTKPVTVTTANFDKFRLIEKQSVSATGQTVESNGAVVTAPKMYMLKGTAVSSWNSATFNNYKTNLTEGRYFVEVHEGGTWKPLRIEEVGAFQITPSTANLSAEFGEENGNAYLRVSSELNATIDTNNDNIEVKLLGGTQPAIKLTFYPMDELAPEGFYIYEFPVNASQAAMDQKISEGPSAYYVPNTPGMSQDQIKIANPFKLKEGEARIFLPVAKYVVNGQEVRRFIPGNIGTRTWYQRERTQATFNFDNTVKTFEANSTFKYTHDADGYPTASTGNKPYKGAPVQAKVINSPYGPALELKAVAMSTINPQDKFANVVLAMSGSSNPVGFWFQVNWVPKKVSDYVLVRDSYVLPQNPDLNSSDPVATGTTDTFKQTLEAELAKVDPNAAIISMPQLKLEALQKVKLPIGTNKLYKLLAIYDNGMVEEVADASTVVELEAVASTNFEDGDITVEAPTDPTLAPSVVQAFATEKGGVKEENRFFTDEKKGRTAKLKVTGFDEIAELVLDSSEVTGFGYIANDELRLLVNETDPTMTGTISQGKWHGQFSVLGLGSDSANPVLVNQGNGSYNTKLVPKMFIIPVYTNKDLTIKKIADITTLDNLSDANFDKIKKLAWASDNWIIDTDKPVSITTLPASSLMTASTSGVAANMGYLGQTFNIKFDLDASASNLNGHPINIDTAGRSKEVAFKIEEPIYDRMGAIGEAVDSSKIEIQNNNHATSIDFGVGIPISIRIKLTNSNLFAMETLALGGTNFEQGVYFVGNEDDTGGILNYKVTDDPTTVVTTRASNTWKDLAIMALASGQKANLKPSVYVDATATTDDYAGLSATDRMALLNAEFAKIKAKIYKKEGSTYTLVTDNSIMFETITSHGHQVPGAYKVTAQKRGDYYVTFVAEHNGVESPIVPADAATNETNYDTAKETYFFRINVSKSKIAKVYNYVPEAQNVTFEPNGKLRIGPLAASSARAEFDIFPIVVDEIVIAQFAANGVTVPNVLDTDGKAKFLEATGKTLEELLADANSGVSYMKPESFNQLTDANFQATTSPLVGASVELDTAKNAYKQHVVVQKGQLLQGTQLMGLITQDGDFNNIQGAPPGTPAVPSRFVKTDAAAKFLPSDAHITATVLDVYQNLNEILQDIVTDPGSATVGLNNTVIFNVKYKTNQGTEIQLTEDNFLTSNDGQPGYLKITPDPNNPEQLVPIKKASENGLSATLSFVPSKIGEYTFYLSTTNELGGRIPALTAEGHPVKFTVTPFIKAQYDLYYRQVQTIDVNTGDPNDNLTYEPDTTGAGILDAAELANGKLKLQDAWATDQNNVLTSFTVAVKKDGNRIGQFTVNAHPRGAVQRYEIIPTTTDTNRYDVFDNETFTINVRAVYADGSMENIDVDANNIQFVDGSDDTFATMLNDSFLTFTNVDAQTVRATATRPTDAVNDRDWLGKWKVMDNPIAGQPALELFSALKQNPVVRPAETLKVYELRGSNLVDVTGKTPAENILHLQTPETKVLYLVDEADPSNLKVINDYSLVVSDPSVVSLRRMSGNVAGTNPQTITAITDIIANPNNFARLEVSPTAQGDATLDFASVRSTATASTGYRVLMGQPLQITIVGPLERTVQENSQLQIQAVVTGGVNPTLQWEESTDGTVFAPISGQTTNVLDITATLPSPKYYRLVATSGVDSATSDKVKVNINPAPTAITGMIQIVGTPTVGQPLTLKAVMNGLQPSDTPTFRWRSKDPATNNVQFLTAETNSDSYNIPNVTADMFNLEYYVTVKVNGQVINLGPVTFGSGGTFTVTFNPGAGTIATGNANLVVAPNTVLTAAQVPTLNAPAGQVFNGWSPSNPAGHTVVADITFTATYRTPSGGGGGGGGGTTTPTTPTPPTRPQTDSKDKAAELNKDYKKAYINGYPDKTVRPNAPITRAEVSAIFARISKKQMVEGQTYSSSFRDVAQGRWYSNFIGFLEADRILTGYPDGTFRPNNRITRAEFATIISKFAELKDGNASFSDIKSNHWAKSYIDNAVAQGWMNGYPNGTFKPDQAITRAEVVTVINKLIERTPNKAQIDAEVGETPRFSDLPKTFWAYYDVIEASTNR